ncbi:hypothetical protein RhiXN_02184 [Rhizoctonia solani]|uniref:Uncharacterized protein n=1 Tax=Rhizoctonia solani TaxID=456999 RepID=A0A8H8P8Q2_9AGAM|nr:uncharacterized protein RhiXN_02184 [Rhizoctonia solani]QRW27589.1 hypothetical protein RhiXN_02184 [Rhizoctonia solani]
MDDSELAAIRAARLNQLQQQAGGSGGSMPAGGFSGAKSGEGASDEGQQSEDQMKRDLLATVLDSSARERLARISLAEESQGKAAPKKVVYQRRKELDDDDFDL